MRKGYALMETPLDAEAVDAFDALADVMKDTRLWMEFTIERGQLQYLNNREFAHYRSEFKDDETRKRHLIRLWFRKQRPPLLRRLTAGASSRLSSRDFLDSACVHHREQAGQLPRLQQERDHVPLRPLVRDLLVVPAGQDHGQAGPAVADMVQDLLGADVRQAEVQDDRARCRRGCRSRGAPPARRGR